MKFFIDTAEFSEIKDAYSYGFIDGVTTNPSLIVKAKRDLKQVIKEIADFVEGPVSADRRSKGNCENPSKYGC